MKIRYDRYLYSGVIVFTDLIKGSERMSHTNQMEKKIDKSPNGMRHTSLAIYVQTCSGGGLISDREDMS